MCNGNAHRVSWALFLSRHVMVIVESALFYLAFLLASLLNIRYFLLFFIYSRIRLPSECGVESWILIYKHRLSTQARSQDLLQFGNFSLSRRQCFSV